jgi:putative intracellular protease/amidase
MPDESSWSRERRAGYDDGRTIADRGANNFLEVEMAQTTGTAVSPEAMAAAIAENHAAAVELPSMMFADNAPVGEIAQRMVDGRYDEAFLISEIERFTGIKADIPSNPGKVLFVIPQHGYWASELTLTDQVFRAAGYEVDYVTPRGERPFPYGVSMDTTFRDQAWNAAQVSPGEAALGQRYHDRKTAEGRRLNTPRSLDSWLPPTPRPQHGEAARETFRAALSKGLLEATQYAALVLVGGAGAYMDLGGNTSVRPLVALFAALNRPVVAICYGVEVLIQATDPKTKVPLVWGRLVTGHSEQDDYTYGTTDVPVEGGYGPNYGSAPITLEQMIKQYTGPQGGFISRNGSPYMAVVDGPFITARTTPDGYPAALLALALMHGAEKLPVKYVVDSDGRGHEPSAAEIRRIAI